MLRPSVASGGVLPVEQSQLHSSVRGVAYCTPTQQQTAVAQLVRPFTSSQIAAAKAAAGIPLSARDKSQQQAMHGTAAHKKASAATRPASAAASSASAARPPIRAASVKSLSSTTHPAAASSSSSRSCARVPVARSTAAAAASQASAVRANSSSRKSRASHSTSSGVGSVGVEHVRRSSVPSADPPRWSDTSVHPPDRPNAPSQMTAEQRAALHKAKVQGRTPKSHKLVVRRHANPWASADESEPQLREQNAEVRIERHARPLLVRPPAEEQSRGAQPTVQFVPIGHVLAVRADNGSEAARNASQSAQEMPQAARRSSSASTPHVPLQPVSTHSLSAYANETYEHQRSTWPAHGLPLGDTEEQKESALSDEWDTSAHRLSVTLSTPHANLDQPQPYSETFHAPAASGAHSAAASSTHAADSGAQPFSSFQQHSARRTSPSTVTSPPPHANGMPTGAHHRSATAPEPLVSPSPARRAQPTPLPEPITQQIPPSHSASVSSAPLTPTAVAPDSSPHAATAAATASSASHEPHSPIRARQSSHAAAHASELARRKLESEHEKAMKNYLSPSNRGPAFRGAASGRTPTKAHFTPNPHRSKDSRSDENRSLSASSSSSDLKYAPVVERPADLPPADPRAGLPVPVAASLYPATPTDPLRHLHATLRGPRLKYEPPQRAIDRSMPFSPAGANGAPAESQANEAEDVHAQLQRERNEAALARQALAREHRDRWQAKWSRLRQGVQQAAAEAREAMSPMARRTAAEQHAEQKEQHASTMQTQRSLSFDFDAAKQNAPNPSHISKQAQTASNGVGGQRVSEPMMMQHGGSNPVLVRDLTTRLPSNGASHPAHTVQSSSPSLSAPPASSSSSSSSPLPPRLILVGSTNATKVGAVRAVVDRIFADVHEQSYMRRSRGREGVAPQRRNQVLGVDVPSGVSPQPLSSAETKAGAIHRARAALHSDPAAEFGVGIEGGIEQVEGVWYENGWVAVVDRHGKVGTATSARLQIADHLVQELLSGRTELSELVDRLSGEQDVRSNKGYMGCATNGVLQRTECYQHAVTFAFAPFVSSNAFWEA